MTIPVARRPFDLPEHREARDYFEMLAERGAPLLSVTLGLAARQAIMWREALASGQIDADDAEDLVGACELVEQASFNQLSGGVFSRFLSANEALAPTKVFGARRPRLLAMEA